MQSVKKTRNWLLSLAAGALLGCAAPQTNPWDSVEIPAEAVEAPLPCSELPAPEAFDEIGKGRIAALSACAQANYDIAAEHVAQIEDMRRAAQNLLDGAQHQRRIADMKQEMLQEERRHHFYEKIGLYAVIIGLGLSL